SFRRSRARQEARLPPLDHAPGPAGLGDQRQTGARPGGHAAVEVLGFEPAHPETLGGAIAPRTAAAHRHDDLLLRDLRQAGRELAQRDVLRALDVAGVPFVLLANIEEMQLGTPLADVLWEHEANSGVREGEMDANAVRERLERERADLAATVGRIRERLAVPQLESGGDVALADQHPADVASETEARELDVARQRLFEDRIALIDEALRRLDRGEYGRCIICGKEIPPARLELVPETPYCVEDAEREQQSSAR